MRKTILRWNDDWRPDVAGYTVAPSNAGSSVVPSACFYDATEYADDAAAAAVGYSVNAAQDAAAPVSEFDPTEAATLTVVRRTFDPAVVDFCVVSGLLVDPGGAGLTTRVDVRFEIAAGDRPARHATAGYLGGTATFKTNWKGEFAVVLPRGVPVLMHAPAAELALRFVVPSAAAARLEDLVVESYDLHRNN